MKERRLLDYWMTEETYFILDEWKEGIVIFFNQQDLIEYQATCGKRWNNIALNRESIHARVGTFRYLASETEKDRSFNILFVR